MLTDCGGFLQTRSKDSPGQVEKYPESVAFFCVERAGDPAVGCKKEMWLSVQEILTVLHGAAGAVAMFVMGTTERRVEVTAAAGAAGSVMGMLTHQRLQEGSMRPVRVTQPWCMTKTVVLRNMPVQPLSVIYPKGIRDLDVMYDKMCYIWAATGRLVRGGSPNGWIPLRRHWGGVH